MASSPLQAILKIEDLTSADKAAAGTKPIKTVLQEDYSIVYDEDDDDEDDDEPMLTMHDSIANDTPSKSCSLRKDDSQNKTVSEDTQTPENRELKYQITKPAQFETMVNFMIANPEFSKGVRKNPISRTKSNEMWRQLTLALNMNGPPRRGEEGWKKVWSDYKSYIRNKLRKNKIYHLEPKGWPKKLYPLTRLEEQVAKLFEYIQNDQTGSDVTSTLTSADIETQAPSTVNSNTVDEPTTQNSVAADQSHDLNIEHDYDEVNEISAKRYSPPLSRKCKKELLQAQIENQKEYTKHSKKILIEINDNLKGLLRYSMKSFDLEQKRFELEKEKFIFKQKNEAQKHQTDMEKLQLQRDILRLKQETAGIID